MPVCPSCQTEAPVNARYCQNCGSLILSRSARRKNKENSGPYGIGGWLILFALGLITSTVTHFTTGIDYYVEEFYLKAIVYLVLVIYSIVCLIYMMRHSSAFPVLFTIYACASTAAVLSLQAPILVLSGEWLSFSILMAYVPVTILWLFYMRRSKRVKNTFAKAATSSPSDSSINAPSGLGGWMVFIVLGLFVGTVSALIYAIQLFIDGSLFMALIMTGILGYEIVCMVFMFRYSRHFPKLFIGLMVILIVLNFLLSLMLYLLINDTAALYELIPAVFWALVSIAYMIRSKRVKNTFVR